MPQDPLPEKQTETDAEQDARLVARLMSRYPRAAKLLGLLVLVSLLALGSTFGLDAVRSGVQVGLRALGVPLAPMLEITDAHDAGAGPAAAEARLRQVVATTMVEQLQAFRESERAWNVQQLAVTEARLNMRIDQAMLMARGRSGIVANGFTPTPWAAGTTNTAAAAAN